MLVSSLDQGLERVFEISVTCLTLVASFMLGVVSVIALFFVLSAAVLKTMFASAAESSAQVDEVMLCCALVIGLVSGSSWFTVAETSGSSNAMTEGDVSVSKGG